jgi:hypothetical protein
MRLFSNLMKFSLIPFLCFYFNDFPLQIVVADLERSAMKMIDKIAYLQNLVTCKLANIDSLDFSDKEWLEQAKSEVSEIDAEVFNLSVNKNSELLEEAMKDVSEAFSRSCTTTNDPPFETIQTSEIDPIVIVSNGLD